MKFLIFIFGEKRFEKYDLPLKEGEEKTIHLNKNYFDLSSDVFLLIRTMSKGWCISYGERGEKGGNIFFERSGSRVNYELGIGKKDRLTIRFIAKEYSFLQYSKFKMENGMRIGRSGENDIVLEKDCTISRKHAEIRREEDQWIIENLSVNGLYVNKEFVKERRQLQYGDIIDISGCSVIFLNAYIAVESINTKGEKTVKKPESESENKAELFKKEVFHRSPRTMENLEDTLVEIDAPPRLEEKETQPFYLVAGSVLQTVFPMLAMNIFLLYGMSHSGEEISLYVYSGILMVVVSALSSLVWAVISRLAGEKAEKTKRERENKIYEKYLDEKDSLIRKKYEESRKTLNSRYFCMKEYMNGDPESNILWNRNPFHSDFMKYRMGIGNQPFQVKIVLPRENYYSGEGVLWGQMKKLKEQYAVLYQVPVLLDLKNNRQIGITGTENVMGLVRNLVMQIAVNNCYTEVKMGFVCDRWDDRWDFCRWLPHTWAADRKRRYIAAGRESARALFYQIANILKEREESNQADALPYYILFLTNPEYIEGELITRYVEDTSNNYGITVVWIVREKEQLPNSCKVILENTADFSGWYNVNSQNQRKEVLKFDEIEGKTADIFARKLSNIRVTESKGRQEIPEVIDFMSLYGVQRAEELKIQSRWEQNKIYESARVLIGKKAGGEFCYLDIHEKYHGPHGLLAGTTGSGKSEVLQTFILSMAVNFSPQSVSFLLIDYKGGGMSGLFAGLPHLCGQISNLSDGQVHRAMVSIKSENRRRQKLFKKCGVNNINDYMRRYDEGELEVAVPYLLIVIDEFAELKKEKPEFMDELISVAQVGRSLGVHLILATQKPGGVVDDKIWSNSRFRICLKVQEKQDSLEMLHNTDASKIMNPGRGYLQVGNDEVYELFQSAWSGAPVIEEKKEEPVYFIQPDGRIASGEKGKKKGKKGKIKTQLDVVKQVITDCAKNNPDELPHPLWMAPLSSRVYLSEIQKEEDTARKEGDCYVGMFDDPECQIQPVFKINLFQSGHLVICGQNGSGKTYFLQTMIFSLIEENPPDSVQFYIIDYNSGIMNIFDSAPHVGEIMGEEEEKIKRFFSFAEEEISERKKKFKGENLEQYRECHDNGDALMVIVIDGFTEFMEKTENRYEDSIKMILREGERLGIIFVISLYSFDVFAISGRIAENFKTRICLHMEDKYSYGDVLGVIPVPVFPEKAVPGRGIAYYGKKILEFQTALIWKEKNYYERQKKMKLFLERKNEQWPGICAKSVRMIPGTMTVEMLQQYIKEESNIRNVIYVGFDDTTARLFGISLKKLFCFLVLGNINEKLNNFFHIIFSNIKIKENNLYFINFKREQKNLNFDDEHFVYINTEEKLFCFLEELSSVFYERSIRGKKEDEKNMIIVIRNLADFLNVVYESSRDMKGVIENIWENGKGYGIIFVGVLNPEDLFVVSGYAAFSFFRMDRNGVQLDGRMADVSIFDAEGVSYETQIKKLVKNEAYYFEKERKPRKIQIPRVIRNDGS
ncbi:MAG: type VII secretion protein EssC [Lachnospiraceae bacterium]|nr:type VII secretion protein EssC [Lachnospiraceae bacterium]